MAAPQAWLYLDDRRTHVVRAAIVREPHLRFVIKESAFGVEDEVETYTTSHRMLDAWEAKMLQMRLEARLTFLGNYYRAEPGGGWTAVRSGTGHSSKGELLPIQRTDGEARVEFHHYGKESEHRAVTLVGVPQETNRGPRYVLARLDFAFPDVEGGHLQLLHAKMPPAVYRSAIASLHLELKELGIEKARPVEGSVSADPRWWAALQAVLDAVLERLTEGRVGKGEPLGSPRRRDNVAMAKAMGLMKEANGAFGAGGKFDTEFEMDGPGSGAVARKGQVGLDEVQSTLLGVLNDVKLIALQNKLIPAEQQAELIEGGEIAIKAAMKRKRAEMTPDQQHLLSIVEASLLVRSALSRKGAKVDFEVVEKLKHAPAWLS